MMVTYGKIKQADVFVAAGSSTYIVGFDDLQRIEEIDGWLILTYLDKVTQISPACQFMYTYNIEKE